MTRRTCGFCVALALLMGVTTPSAAAFESQSGPSSQDLRDAEYLQREAEALGEFLGIDAAAARDRLDVEQRAGFLDSKLSAMYPDAYGGMWIESGPELSIAIAGTSSAIDLRTVDADLAKYVRLVHVPRTQAALVADADRLGDLLGMGPYDIRVNLQENRVEVLVTAGAMTAFIAPSDPALPFTIVPVDAVASSEADIYGGLGLSGCTAGYGVKRNSDGQKGISTAGHCSNSQARNGTSLPFVAELVGGHHDEQWHTPAGFTVRNWVIDNNVGHTHSITGKKEWGNQVAGQTVCKYGNTTGYTCGEIVTKFYDPESCLAGSQFATFVQVHRNGVNESEAGDSGGPWYGGLSAYGTHSCGLGDDAIYTPEDYVELGLSIQIMTAP